MKRKYLFIPLSSFGYVFPAIRMAHILQERSHEVLFAGDTGYNSLLEMYGINHFGIHNQKSQYPFLYPGHWYSTEGIVEAVQVLEQAILAYKPDVIVSSPLVVAAFILAERHSIPLVVMGFCEYLYPGIGEKNSGKEWRILELTKVYNGARGMLGLEPIEPSVTDTPLIGQKYLLRSIPALSRGQVLPAPVKHIGAFYWEPEYVNKNLFRFIAESVQNKEPVIYIQIGRLFEEGVFWPMFVDMLKDLPMKFVVDVGRSDYIGPAFQIPDNFFVSPFIPLGKISRDVNFVICSGQSTSVVSSIVHGKQLLLIPHSADSHELSHKLVEEGIGIGIFDKNGLTLEHLQACFHQLLNNAHLENVLHLQKMFKAYDVDDQIFETISASF